MVLRRRLTVAALLLAAGFLSARTASAGPLLRWLCPDNCPVPSYSPFRYWTPALARAHDAAHGPRLSVEAPDRHPEIAPTYTIFKYPCPAVDPAATIFEPPSPPATSRFRY